MYKRFVPCSHCDTQVDRYSPYSVSEGLHWFCNRHCKRWYQQEQRLGWPILLYLAVCIIVLGFAAKYAFGKPSLLWNDSPYAAEISAAENMHGQRCCDIADGVQVTDAIVKNGHYTFVYDGKEYVVEDWMLISNERNPLGHALAWFFPTGVLRCFWPGVES